MLRDHSTAGRVGMQLSFKSIKQRQQEGRISVVDPVVDASHKCAVHHGGVQNAYDSISLSHHRTNQRFPARPVHISLIATALQLCKTQTCQGVSGICDMHQLHKSNLLMLSYSNIDRTQGRTKLSSDTMPR